MIEAIEKARANVGHNLERSIGKSIIEILDEVGEDVGKLPSAQPELLQPWEVLAAQAVLAHPEPHWIPVTERLPKEEGFYLVTLGYKHGAETNIRFFKTESGKRYWSLWGNENITAWMPKPEPYKGVKE